RRRHTRSKRDWSSDVCSSDLTIVKMDNIELVIIVAILALGVFSQWFAWRIQWPSIVIMSIVGLLIGPVIGVINPGEALGDLYNRSEERRVGKGVRSLWVRYG